MSSIIDYIAIAMMQEVNRRYFLDKASPFKGKDNKEHDNMQLTKSQKTAETIKLIEAFGNNKELVKAFTQLGDAFRRCIADFASMSCKILPQLQEIIREVRIDEYASDGSISTVQMMDIVHIEDILEQAFTCSLNVGPMPHLVKAAQMRISFSKKRKSETREHKEVFFKRVEEIENLDNDGRFELWEKSLELCRKVPIGSMLTAPMVYDRAVFNLARKLLSSLGGELRPSEPKQDTSGERALESLRDDLGFNRPVQGRGCL